MNRVIQPRYRGYGEPRIDLTPIDLYVAGYVILPHCYRGWCWRCPNPYGTGTMYGAWYDRPEEAVKDARRLIAARTQRQPTHQLALAI